MSIYVYSIMVSQAALHYLPLNPEACRRGTCTIHLHAYLENLGTPLRDATTFYIHSKFAYHASARKKKKKKKNKQKKTKNLPTGLKHVDVTLTWASDITLT